MEKIINYSYLRDYLKRNIKQDCVRSLFVAGSVKDKLLIGSDIDIFAIVYKNKLNSFLNDLTKNMRLFIKNNPKFTYSFFRGPIKFESKILLHFIIYTDNLNRIKSVQDFQNEPPQVFEGILNKYDLILGEDPIRIKGEMDLDNSSRHKREEYMKLKSEYFFRNGAVKYKEWKKKNSNWVFADTIIKLSPWQKDKLGKYFLNYKGIK